MWITSGLYPNILQVVLFYCCDHFDLATSIPGQRNTPNCAACMTSNAAKNIIQQFGRTINYLRVLCKGRSCIDKTCQLYNPFHMVQASGSIFQDGQATENTQPGRHLSFLHREILPQLSGILQLAVYFRCLSGGKHQLSSLNTRTIYSSWRIGLGQNNAQFL